MAPYTTSLLLVHSPLPFLSADCICLKAFPYYLVDLSLASSLSHEQVLHLYKEKSIFPSLEREHTAIHGISSERLLAFLPVVRLDAYQEGFPPPSLT